MKKTLEQWSKEGYRVKKGARHVGRNAKNVPLFDETQVWHPELAQKAPKYNREYDSEYEYEMGEHLGLGDLYDGHD